VAEFILPRSVTFGELRTFRDLAVAIAGGKSVKCDGPIDDLG
jgi:hypothetical protein